MQNSFANRIEVPAPHTQRIAKRALRRLRTNNASGQLAAAIFSWTAGTFASTAAAPEATQWYATKAV
ncbi:hypothetical protein ACX80E_03030 [Arthrobacter sp. TMN-49]